MIPVADPFMAGVRPNGLQRGRGGFLRSADDAPYVSDPSGETVKTGDRKGEVKRLKYGSPSNRGLAIEAEGGLLKHKQRYSVLGFGLDPSLAESCKQLIGMDFDSQEYRNIADGIMARAERVADGMLAADRGTHGHLITERCDRDETITEADIAAGQAVGLDRRTMLGVVVAWANMLATNGLEILAIEASCVDDTWRLAGTLDRIVRTTKPLTFAKPGGELVTIPADTVIVLDIKFGKCRKAHPIQIASYAQSAPYDTEVEVRDTWPWQINQEHALIAHGDFGDEVRPVSIELVWVDLVAGRDHGGQCVVDAKAWAARDDVFSVSQISAGAPEPSAPLTAGEGDGAAMPPSPASSQGVIKMAGVFDCSPQLADEFDAYTQAENKLLEVTATFLAPDPDRLALVDARASLCATPDQGADLSGAEHGDQWAALQRHYNDLDAAARSWLAELIGEATRRGVDFHARRARTLRVFELYRALISLCAADGGTDELLRALLALIVGDVALFPSIHPGHVVGSLSAAEATRFAALVDHFNGPGLAAYIDNDGLFRLRAFAA